MKPPMNPHQHKGPPLFIPEINKHPAPKVDHWIYSEAVHYHDGPGPKVMLQVYSHKGPIKICPALAVYNREGIYSHAARRMMTQEDANAIWEAFLHKMGPLTHDETVNVLAAARFARALK